MTRFLQEFGHFLQIVVSEQCKVNNDRYFLFVRE